MAQWAVAKFETIERLYKYSIDWRTAEQNTVARINFPVLVVHILGEEAEGFANSRDEVFGADLNGLKRDENNKQRIFDLLWVCDSVGAGHRIN